MKKVAIIANEFPPMGGAGVQRTTKFVKYLPSFGIKPIVITKEHVAKLTDKSLLEDLPKDLRIYRLKAYDTVNRSGLLSIPYKFIGTRILSPDSEFFWYYNNRKQVLNIIKKENIGTIYTTSFPYSSHLLGLYLKKEMPKLRWITDFRDEWTNNPYHLDSKLKKIKLNAEKKKELEVTNNCDYLITNTPFMLENFIKDNESLEGRSTYIPNGYDEDDFNGIDTSKDDSGKFVITYTGSLYGRRNLDEFMDGLKISIDENRIDKNDIEIRIVGNIYEKAINEYREKYNLNDQIKSFGYLPHKESIRTLFKSHVLLLVIGKGKGSKNFYTGKIFEYIRTNRPILGIVPTDGAAASVIQETDTGYTVDPEDIVKISHIIEKYYFDWKNNLNSHSPNWDNIRKYNRKSQTEQLARILKDDEVK